VKLCSLYSHYFKCTTLEEKREPNERSQQKSRRALDRNAREGGQIVEKEA